MCPYKDPEKRREAVRNWFDKHPNYSREYYGKHREEIKKKNKKRWKKYSEKLRLKILIHYGGNPPKCNHCGIEDIQVLTIDHIEGKERGKKRLSGVKFYLWLIKNNFPKGFQVLCRNCNWKKMLAGK